MTLISFNINGIRARLHQLQAVIDKYQPALIGLQETKVHDPEFPEQAVRDMGYHPYYFGQKGHYGVALITREPLESVQYGFPTDEDDAQRRMIIGTLKHRDGSLITVLNGYFPQGENREHPVKFPAKEKFYQDLQNYLDQHQWATSTSPQPILILALAKPTANAGCAKARPASCRKSANGGHD